MTYKLIKDYRGNIASINRLNEMGNPVESIPLVEGNTDYDKYLKWLADGNTPLPADENN